MAEQGADFAERVFGPVADQVLAEHPGDEQGRMLHAPGLRTAGRFYAFATAEEVVVKLPADRVQALVADGTGLPCSPRPGRPMREWVCLPDLDEVRCRAFVLEARAFVAGLRG